MSSYSYFAHQAESTQSTGSFAYIVFWFLVAWAWTNAALMVASVNRGDKATTYYGAAAFVVFTVAAAIWFVRVL